MSFSDRTYALNYLGMYQRASLVPSLNALETHLDSKYPGFLDLWGRAVRNLPQSYVKLALEKLARVNGMSFPSRPDLNDILMNGPSASLGTAIVTGSKEAVKEIGEVSGNVLKFGAPLLILAGAAYFAFSMGLFRAPKSA